MDSAWTRKIRDKQALRSTRILKGEDTEDDESSAGSGPDFVLPGDGGGPDVNAKKEKKTSKGGQRKPKEVGRTKPNRYEVGVE